MLELKVKAGRRMVPIFDLPTALGRRGAAQEIGDTIDALIAFMDDLDGDPDLERDDSEDGFEQHRLFGLQNGPGCPISDAGGGNITDELHDGDGDDQDGDRAEDEPPYGLFYAPSGPGCPISDAVGDVSWPEWHTRGRHKTDQFGSEAGVKLPGRYYTGEDDEDDDPDTGVEDGPFDAEEDRCEAGDDMVLAGPVRDRELWLRRRGYFGDITRQDIGSEDDAEYSAHGADDV